MGQCHFCFISVRAVSRCPEEFPRVEGGKDWWSKIGHPVVHPVNNSSVATVDLGHLVGEHPSLDAHA